MFSSKLGIRLLLWIGRQVPRPAPYEVMNAFRSLEVITDVSETNDGFELTFTLGKDKQGDYTLLQSGALDPDSRVVIGVLLGARLETLIDGVIYNHQVSPGDQPGSATLTVSGRDVSVVLDLEEKDAQYINEKDSDIVKNILGDYAQFGIFPPFDVTTAGDAPNEDQRIPRQHETDLRFIQRLARRNGFVFYIEPRMMGENTAYWGPENRGGMPQAPLTHGLGPASNVKSLRVTNDALAPVEVNGRTFNPVEKRSEQISPPETLRSALSSSAATARRTQRLRHTASRRDNLRDTWARAAVSLAPEPIRAEGELETVRYGGVLRPRRLVGVRGLSRAYDGDYFVRRVTHRIQRGVYTQSFTLSREGIGARSSNLRVEN
jgi:phage protein D